MHCPTSLLAVAEVERCGGASASGRRRSGRRRPRRRRRRRWCRARTPWTARRRPTWRCRARRPAGRPASGSSQIASNCLPTDRSPTSSASPSASAPADGAQPEQVRRGQGQSLVAEQPLHEVGLQTLLEHREPGARTDVRAHRRPAPRPRRAGAGGTARCRGPSCWSGSAPPRRPARRGWPARRRSGGRCGPAPSAASRARAGRRCRRRTAPPNSCGDLGDLGGVLVDVRGEPGALDLARRSRRRTRGSRRWPTARSGASRHTGGVPCRASARRGRATPRRPARAW